MSLNLKQNVKCPKCSQMSEVTVWNSITVKDSEDLKHDLLTGKVNMFRCPSCSYSALLKSQLFDNVQKSSKESGELDKLEGYNLRFVTDYNELLEKILIFDNDMNDKTMEVIKLMVLSQDLEKAEQRVCRFGKCQDEVIEFMIYDTIENQTYTSKVPKETYDTIHKQLLESGMKPYSFGWEMVDASYATRLLNGFNN